MPSKKTSAGREYEIDGKRVRALGENLERWGAKNTLITNDSVNNLAKYVQRRKNAA